MQMIFRRSNIPLYITGTEDILEKSVDGSYPPYGPLFWYVPEYDLYEPLLLTLGDWEAEASFSKKMPACAKLSSYFVTTFTAALREGTTPISARLARIALIAEITLSKDALSSANEGILSASG